VIFICYFVISVNINKTVRGLLSLLTGVSVFALCHNGGTCKDVGTSYRCQCRTGYEGSHCELDVDECASQPCRNGARCHNLVGRYSCDCPPGYQGTSCEFDVDECATRPCQNGGTCHDLVNGFRCSCPPGTKGLLCEIDAEDNCRLGMVGDESPCHHGGTCVDRVHRFECLCRPGFVGPQCEGDVNECLSNPCIGSGVQDCIQLVNDYRCVCRDGWTGRHCEVKQLYCDTRPCQNGGKCVEEQNGSRCNCPMVKLFLYLFINLILFIVLHDNLCDSTVENVLIVVDSGAAIKLILICRVLLCIPTAKIQID